MKIVNAIIAALFVLFAYYQFNDPDPWTWVPIYALVAVAAALAFFDKFFLPGILVLAAVCLIFLCLSAPGVYQYVTNEDGATITDAMSTDKPYIESTREFGGALLALTGLAVIGWQAIRRNANKKQAA